MKPIVSLRRALADPRILGGLLDGPSWERWRALLIGAMGEPLSAYEQFRLFTALGDTLPAFAMVETEMREAGDVFDLATALKPLKETGEEETGAVFAACIGACERLDGESWVAATRHVNFVALLAIVRAAVTENFASLLSMRRPEFRPVMGQALQYQPVTLPDSEDWLWRPAAERLCLAESLLDGTLRIENVARLNDVLDVRQENEARARQAAERK